MKLAWCCDLVFDGGRGFRSRNQWGGRWLARRTGSTNELDVGTEPCPQKLGSEKSLFSGSLLKSLGVEGIVSDVVELSRTGLVSTGEGENIGPVVEKSFLLEEDDATEQCISGDTEERYHQPIDRSGLTLASRLQRSMGQRERIGIPRTPLSSLRDAAHGKLAGWIAKGVNRKQIKQQSENIERNLRKRN
ncbi:hypothetical protein TNCV_3748731 [Trichonephila clavipes]|nr:hypothetical protein TNCV_3748731 [Trichonephila clavipes]